VDGSGTGAGVGTGSDGLTSKEREQLHLQSSAFDALERDFREVLNELVGDKSLERFRLEYEKLHHTLKKSHENEVRWRGHAAHMHAETRRVRCGSAVSSASGAQPQQWDRLQRGCEAAWR
jgi:hypothetical protein